MSVLTCKVPCSHDYRKLRKRGALRAKMHLLSLHTCPVLCQVQEANNPFTDATLTGGVGWVFDAEFEKTDAYEACIASPPSCLSLYVPAGLGHNFRVFRVFRV